MNVEYQTTMASTAFSINMFTQCNKMPVLVQIEPPPDSAGYAFTINALGNHSLSRFKLWAYLPYHWRNSIPDATVHTSAHQTPDTCHHMWLYNTAPYQEQFHNRNWLQRMDSLHNHTCDERQQWLAAKVPNSCRFGIVAHHQQHEYNTPATTCQWVQGHLQRYLQNKQGSRWSYTYTKLSSLWNKPTEGFPFTYASKWKLNSKAAKSQHYWRSHRTNTLVIPVIAAPKPRTPSQIRIIMHQ